MYSENYLTHTRTARCGMLRTTPPHLPHTILRLHYSEYHVYCLSVQQQCNKTSASEN